MILLMFVYFLKLSPYISNKPITLFEISQYEINDTLCLDLHVHFVASSVG